MSETLRHLRRSERLDVVLPAKCRSRSGFLDRVMITDISSGGCRIASKALTVHVGDLVVIRPDGIEGLCGEVRWVKGHDAGIAFAERLYPPVVDHLHRRHATFLGGMDALADTGLRRAA